MRTSIAPVCAFTALPTSSDPRGKVVPASLSKWLAIAAISAATCSSPARGFEIIQDGAAQVSHNGVVTIVEFPKGPTFTITELPLTASNFESYEEVPPSLAEAFSSVTTGELVSQREAIDAIEAEYRDSAIDFQSIQIRGMQVHGQRRVRWCTATLFMVCTDYQLRAGTWVEFEVNGRNRSGGMTGFQRRVVMLRKVPTQ